MQHLEVSGAVRPLKWSLGVKWLFISPYSKVLHEKLRGIQKLKKSLEYILVTSLQVLAGSQ